jgi:protease I
VRPTSVSFVKAFQDASRPVVARWHGAWTIIETGAARGRRIVAAPSLRTDLRNARGEWVDQGMVVDGNLRSSRTPGDIPASNRGMVELFGKVRPQIWPTMEVSPTV